MLHTTMCLWIGLSMFAVCWTSQADELVVIDLTVENEVTFRATDGLSDITTSGSNLTGIYFDNLFGGPSGPLGDLLEGTPDFSSFLNPASGSPGLFRAGNGVDPGLNFFLLSSEPTLNFARGTQAFRGTATYELAPSSWNDMLNGSSQGDIYFPAEELADIDTAVVPGTYRIVRAIPEPSGLIMIALVFGAMAGTLRRRR